VLRTAEFLEDGFELIHDALGKKLMPAGLEHRSLDCGAAGLLEGLRQLQDAAFPERRTENL